MIPISLFSISQQKSEDKTETEDRKKTGTSDVFSASLHNPLHTLHLSVCRFFFFYILLQLLKSYKHKKCVQTLNDTMLINQLKKKTRLKLFPFSK